MSINQKQSPVLWIVGFWSLNFCSPDRGHVNYARSNRCRAA